MSDDLFQRLRKAYCAKSEDVPPGFKSRAQLQDEWGVSRSYAKELINAGVRDGMLEVLNLKMGRAVVPHYKPTDKKSSTARPKRR